MPETFSSLTGEIARLRDLLRDATARAEAAEDLIERIDTACEASPGTLTPADVRRIIAEAAAGEKGESRG